MTIESRTAAILLLLTATGCGGRGSSEGEAAEVSEELGAVGQASANAVQDPGPSRGTFTLGGTTYSFRVVRCDLSGEKFDGMLLAGSGTTPDGQRLAVEVERVDGERVAERASVMMGAARDGEAWSARRAQGPGGSWYADEAGQIPADGPLIRISGSDLTVETAFGNRAGSGSEAGVLRASCARIPG